MKRNLKEYILLILENHKSFSDFFEDEKNKEKNEEKNEEKPYTNKDELPQDPYWYTRPNKPKINN